MLHNRALRAKELLLISSAQHFHGHGYKVTIGDQVQLNSGGPVTTVVDVLPCEQVCISWRDGAAVREQQISMRCVHRVGLSDSSSSARIYGSVS